MSKFQQRHYEAIAEVFQKVTLLTEMAGLSDTPIQMLRESLTDMFARDNYHFMRDRFNRACEPGANVKARTK